MSNAKFTPGPWAWHEDNWNGGWKGLYADNWQPIVVPQSCNDGDDGAAWLATVDDADEEGLTDADRALIAAAPELYEALSYLNENGEMPLGTTIDDLLAEARGES